MTSEYSLTREFPMTKGRSKPMDTILPIWRISKILMVGLMPGSVICHILRIREQPSISEASYNSLLMPVMAAR
ncbi:hypothetical protein D3C75_1302130 [compost metagenome]